MRSSDNGIFEALKGRETIRQFAELQDPEKLVPLAATALNAIHPEMDKMETLVACRDALRRLVNKVQRHRAAGFNDFLSTKTGWEKSK